MQPEHLLEEAQQLRQRTGIRRRVWLRVHRYVGLGLGLMLAVVGLTGSFLVFWQPIGAILNPALLQKEQSICPAGADRPLEELLDAAEDRMPPNGRISGVMLSKPERPVLSLQVDVPAPGADWADRYQLFVNVCTVEITGPRLWEAQKSPLSGPLMAVVMRFHTSLLLNQRGLWLGNHILSIGSIVLMCGVMSGLYLSWPRGGRWRSVFDIKHGAGFVRKNLDLHRTTGVCAGVLLLMSLFTGIHMYAPWHEFINAAVRLLSPATAFGAAGPIALPEHDGADIGPSKAINIARDTLPGSVAISVGLPAEGRRTYLVNLDTKASWTTLMTVDARTGLVLASQGPQNATAGDSFLNWLFLLHTGQGFGLVGRVIILGLGLLPTVLFATGAVWWRRKRRARSKQAARLVSQRT